jgi:large subunit ribosomal protein L15
MSLDHRSVFASPGSRMQSKRLGRGDSSGKGNFSGKGCKGQKARTGKGKIHPLFEGGQTPLFRRMPKKKGFTSLTNYRTRGINIRQIATMITGNTFAISHDTLVEYGYIHSNNQILKILGVGEIPATKGLEVWAHAYSADAKAKLTAAGATLHTLPMPHLPEVITQKVHAVRLARKAAMASA